MRDPVYKALTRPAMIFDVPMVPFLVIETLIILISLWVNYIFETGLWGLVLCPAAYFIMRLISKFDDSGFDLLILKARFRIPQRKSISHFSAAVYSPIKFKTRKR